MLAMSRKACVTFLLLQILSHLPCLVNASSDGVTATCNDDNTVTVNITYSRSAKILSGSYGNCSVGDAGISGDTGLSTTGWELTLDVERCHMNSKLRTLDYNQTAKFVVGVTDQSIDLVKATFEIDSYCSYTTEYTLSFDYNVATDEYETTDTGGLLDIVFVIDSFNSNFSETQATSNQAGQMVYLGIYINETASPNFDHASSFNATAGKMFVPTKWWLNDSVNTYTLFDTNNGAKCSNDILDLAVGYKADTKMWTIEHLLFLLKSNFLDTVNYRIECNIKVCDMSDASECLAAAACLSVQVNDTLSNDSPVNDEPVSQDMNCTTPLKQNGTEMECILDWDPIFDHMPRIQTWVNGSYHSKLEFDDPAENFRDTDGYVLRDICNYGNLGNLTYAVAIINHIDNTGALLNELLHMTNYNGDTPLLRCALNSDDNDGIEKMKLLADLGSDKTAVDRRGKNALHWAVQTGSADAVKFIIEQGWPLDLEARDDDGRTAIMTLTDSYHPEAVAKATYLASAGARTDVVDNDGYGLLALAAREGTVELAKYLVDNYGISDYKQGPHERTPLMLTTRFLFNGFEDQYQVMQYLVDNGANVNSMDKYSQTILHNTVRGGSKESLEIVLDLVDRGLTTFGMDSRDEWGRNALYRARKRYDDFYSFDEKDILTRIETKVCGYVNLNRDTMSLTNDC